jgi:spore coat protein H
MVLRLVTCSWCAAGVVVAGSGLESQALSRADAEARAFFASTNALTFHVELSSAEYRQLAREPRKYVSGRVSVGGCTFEQVGVRLKGTGTFEPVSKHPNLTLKFTWKRPTQEFAGLTKIFLNNSRQDPTFLCELAASGAFADAGLPVPRITQGHVVLNGRDFGPCVVAEAVNKRFLKRHFNNSHGNLYEGEFRDIRARLQQENGDRGNQADLQELAAAALRTDPGERRQVLAKVLDMQRFLDFLIVEMFVANWDGYAYHQNNYRIYHDPVSDKMVIIPHGLDNTFFESGLGLMPPRTSVLASAILETPAEREAFRQRAAVLLPQVLDTARIRARLRDGVDRLSQGASLALAQGYRRRGELLLQRVEERARHLQEELNGIKPITPNFNWLGTAPLTGWQPKPDWNDSPVGTVLTNGRPLLGICATNGWCFGSWRLPLWLPAGRYQIEGLATTTGVVGLSSRTGSGAGVRVLGSMRGSGVQGSQGWMPVQEEFVVEPGCESVELIAELRAFSGTALFDPEKFKLVRVRF